MTLDPNEKVIALPDCKPVALLKKAFRLNCCNRCDTHVRNLSSVCGRREARLPQSGVDDGRDLAGTLHLSLPTDIIQLFGTGSVPV